MRDGKNEDEDEDEDEEDYTGSSLAFNVFEFSR
jgi:hypothetical protein